MCRFAFFRPVKGLKAFLAVVTILSVFSLIAGFIQPQPVNAAGAIWQPTSAAPIHWQWQIGTPFSITSDLVPHVTVYDIDAFDTSAGTVAALHAQGCIVIAYMSFGTWEDWRNDAGDFPSSVKGSGNGWPGEKWLDIRSTSCLTSTTFAA
jgi:hypothetical protein